MNHILRRLKRHRLDVEIDVCLAVSAACCRKMKESSTRELEFRANGSFPLRKKEKLPLQQPRKSDTDKPIFTKSTQTIKQRNQSSGPEIWSRILARNSGSEPWSRPLIQSSGPEFWSGILVQTSYLELWFRAHREGCYDMVITIMRSSVILLPPGFSGSCSLLGISSSLCPLF